MATRALAAALIALAACGGTDDDDGVDPTQPVTIDLAAPPATKLSAYHLFTWDPATGFTWNPVDGRVVPYDLNSTLFSDHAIKQRAIYLPPGTAATYDPEEAFELPVGSVVIKNFLFPADFRAPTEELTLVETRLLIRHEDGWHPLPYVWDADQRDATFKPGGEVRPITFIDESGGSLTASYLVPQRNQCESCHARKLTPDARATITLIGPKARHLNRRYDYGGAVGAVNQLDHLTSLGMLTGAPPSATVPAAYDFRPIEAGGVAAIPAADVDAAARAYLDINCAHCHNPQGPAHMSGLDLSFDQEDAGKYGVFKSPIAAGRGSGGYKFGIEPGHPENSILMHRIESTEAGVMMPPLPKRMIHDEGIALLREWIQSMRARVTDSNTVVLEE